MNTTCVCLICFKPNDIWFDFLATFTRYDIYIVIDDNSKNYKEKYSHYKNIQVVQIQNEECKRNGFTNMNFIIKKTISGWEKAVYYFSSVKTDYEKVWVFEDDVFFYSEASLLDIDRSYPASDLLSNSYTENKTGHKNDWHWKKINIQFPPPYYNAMVCAIRVSNRLLQKIKIYAIRRNSLFFLEALFPTFCKKYNLQYDTPSVFQNIVYRKIYEDKDITRNNLYHPVKDITKHTYYRNKVLGQDELKSAI